MKQVLGILLLLGMQATYVQASNSDSEGQRMVEQARGAIAQWDSFDKAWKGGNNDRLSFFDSYPEYPQDVSDTLRGVVTVALLSAAMMGSINVPKEFVELSGKCKVKAEASEVIRRAYQRARAIAEFQLDVGKWFGVKPVVRKYFGCCMKSNFPRKKTD